MASCIPIPAGRENLCYGRDAFHFVWKELSDVDRRSKGSSSHRVSPRVRPYTPSGVLLLGPQNARCQGSLDQSTGAATTFLEDKFGCKLHLPARVRLAGDYTEVRVCRRGVRTVKDRMVESVERFYPELDVIAFMIANVVVLESRHICIDVARCTYIWQHARSIAELEVRWLTKD